MNQIVLTRKQINQFVEFAAHFKDIDWVTLEQSHASGIGANIYIKCSLFGNHGEPETTVDITDVSVW
jgi:hypothetical protein